MKKRQGEPWIPAAAYGHLLPAFTVNLLVRDIDAALPFYRDVLEAAVHYADPDFAAVRVGGAEIMLHADHSYDAHPWYEALASGARRGLGAELRLLGFDPDDVARRAEAGGFRIVRPVTVRGHGWREVMVEDADGYVWAVGELTRDDDAAHP